MTGGELCVPTGIGKDSGCGHMRTTVPTGLVLHPSRDMPPRLLWSYVIVALTKAYFFFFKTNVGAGERLSG